MGTYLSQPSQPSQEHDDLCALLRKHSLLPDYFEPTEHSTCVVNFATSLPPVYKGPTGDSTTGCYVSRSMVFTKLATSDSDGRVHVLPRPNNLVTWPGDWGEGRWIHKDALLELDAPRFDVEAVREAIAEGRHRHGMYACFYAVDGAGAKTLVVLRGLTFKMPTDTNATRRVPVLDKNDSKYLVVDGHRVRLKDDFRECTGRFYRVPIGAPLPPADATPRARLPVAGTPRVVFAAPSHTSQASGMIAVNDTYDVFGDFIHSSCHASEHLPWLYVRFKPMGAMDANEVRFGYTLGVPLSDDQKRILREAGYDVGVPRETYSSDPCEVPLEAAAPHDAEAHKELCSLLDGHKLLPRTLLAPEYRDGTAAIPLVHAVGVDLALAYADSTSKEPVLTTDMGACFEVKERRDGRLRVRPRCDGAAWPRDLWVPKDAVLEIDAPRFDPDAVREAIELKLHTLGMYSCYYVLEKDTDGGTGPETKTLVVLLGPTLARSSCPSVSQRVPVFHCKEQVKANVAVLPLLEKEPTKMRASTYNLQSRCLGADASSGAAAALDVSTPAEGQDEDTHAWAYKLQSRCLTGAGSKAVTGSPCSLPLRAPVSDGEEWCGVGLKGHTMYGALWVLYAAPSHTAEMVGVVPCDAEFEVGAVVDAARPFVEGTKVKHSMLWLRARAGEWYDPTEAPRSQLKILRKGLLEGFVLAQGLPDDKLAELREKGLWQHAGGSNWGVGGN